MKKILIYAAILLCTKATIAQELSSANFNVKKLAGFDNFYNWGQFYFAGQPTLEQLNYLQEKGVAIVINLRSNEEKMTFTKTAFNEKNVAKELGFDYHELPIKSKSDYSPKALQSFIELLPTDTTKVLIHCKGAGRVTLFMMAYLISEHNYTFEQAKLFGEQITYFSHIDALLGKK